MVERRQPKPTVDFIDEYCEYYKKLFSDVRGFEAFKFLHMGMISDIKRKTLPASLPSGGASLTLKLWDLIIISHYIIF